MCVWCAVFSILCTVSPNTDTPALHTIPSPHSPTTPPLSHQPPTTPPLSHQPPTLPLPHSPTSPHTLTSHCHTLTSHRHTLTSHCHTLTSHRHTLTLHCHTLTSHRHTLTLHCHTLTLSGEVALDASGQWSADGCPGRACFLWARKLTPRESWEGLLGRGVVCWTVRESQVSENCSRASRGGGKQRNMCCSPWLVLHEHCTLLQSVHLYRATCVCVCVCVCVRGVCVCVCVCVCVWIRGC